MLYLILFVTLAVTGGYFAFRYFSLIFAIKKITKDTCEIQRDLTQNQMLCLPLPNKHLKNMLSAFNSVLEEIQKERQGYESREKEFQKQIENISHDLRTPLTVILGYLKLFRKTEYNKVPRNTELLETLNIIQLKAEAMNSLVTQFYDYSRITTGDFRLLISSVDISRTLRESLTGNYQILEQAHLRLNLDIPDCPVWGLGEKSALERIFFNLVQNAGRYAHSYLRVSLEEKEGEISVSFANDTLILTEEEIPHVFERFYMQDGSRSQGGTGLGLTVAKSLAEEMNASLCVKVIDKPSKEKPLSICFELKIPIEPGRKPDYNVIN